jgi:DNA mismatch endonuclease, patch repair protein
MDKNMDRLTPIQRSINMSKVKSKNTGPELYVFNELKKNKITFKKHYDTYGKPDIAIPNKKIVVFINGEFWHGRRYAKEKQKYPEFWVNKIYQNMKRDRKNYLLLKNAGWKVIKIWDKDIKKHPSNEINKVLRALGLADKSNLKI